MSFCPVQSNCIGKNYNFNPDNRTAIEKAWMELPYKEFKGIDDPSHLLFSFTTEDVQVFLFRKETNHLSSISDVSLKVFALSKKEINLILKSSFSKLKNIFSANTDISTIEGTFVSFYPFDFRNDDVLSPLFCVKAAYDEKGLDFKVKDWIKFFCYILISFVFGLLYFITDGVSSNNLKGLYAILMGLGFGLTLNDLITILENLYSYYFVKHPSVSIKNFSNIFENQSSSYIEESNNEEPKKLVDPKI